MTDELTLESGTVFRSQVADGYAYYEIVEVGEEISVVKPRDDKNPDNYRWDAVTSDGRVLTDNIRAKLNQMNTLNELFGAN